MDYNVLDEQNKEAERLGMKLDPMEDEIVPENDELKPEQEPAKKIDEEKPEEKQTEDDSEDEADQKLEPKRPLKGSLQQEAFKQREQKRLQGIVSEQLTAALSPITKMLEDLRTARTPEQKEEVAENIDDELSKIAEIEKIPVDQFKRIVTAISKQVQANIAPQLKQVEQVAPMLERQQQEEQERHDKEIFNTEWENEAEPVLTEQYTNANAKQMKQARELLKGLAVSPEYGDTRGNKEGLPEHPAYPVKYILFQEAEKFDTILNSPRKKSFESAGAPLEDEDAEPRSLEELSGKEITSTADAIKLSKDLDRAYGKEKTIIMRNGEPVDVSD